MAEIGDVLRKRLIATLLLFGIFLAWIGALLSVLDGDLAEVGQLVGFTGLLLAFAVALVGALGSSRTTDTQNLGLLIVAAALILAAAWSI